MKSCMSISVNSLVHDVYGWILHNRRVGGGLAGITGLFGGVGRGDCRFDERGGIGIGSSPDLLKFSFLAAAFMVADNKSGTFLLPFH